MNSFGFFLKLTLSSFVIIIGIVFAGFDIRESNSVTDNDLNNNDSEILWHVKAFRPEAKLLKVKAIDKEGNFHDVKAIQNSDDTSILDVKAFVNGKILPIKILMNETNNYLPVKAIDDDGTIIDIKALTEDGRLLDVKGVSKSGNVVHIRAITKNGTRFNIIAISPKGIVNDVKGIKMQQTDLETTIKGVEVFAHVKSISQK